MATYSFFRNAATGRGGKTMPNGTLSHQSSEDDSNRFGNFGIQRKNNFGGGTNLSSNNFTATNKSKEFTARRGGISSTISSRIGDKSDTFKSTDQKGYVKQSFNAAGLASLTDTNASAFFVGEKLMGARTGTPFGSGVWKADTNATFKSATFKKADVEVASNGVPEGNNKKNGVIQKNIELNKGWDDIEEEERHSNVQSAAVVREQNLEYVKPVIPLVGSSAADKSAQVGKKDHQKVTFNTTANHQVVSSTSAWHPSVASTPQKTREGAALKTACDLSPIVCGASLNVRESVVVPKVTSEKFTMTNGAPLQCNGNSMVNGSDAKMDVDGTFKCHQSHLSELNLIELVIDRLHNDDRYKLFQIAESMYNSAKEFRDFVQKVAGGQFEKH